jgi:hypothetical protein
MGGVQRKAKEELERMKKEIKREQEEQPNRIIAPPAFREPKEKKEE